MSKNKSKHAQPLPFRKSKKKVRANVNRVPVTLDLLAVAMKNGTATIQQQEQFVSEVNSLIVNVIEMYGFDFGRWRTRDDVLLDIMSMVIIPNLQEYDVTKGRYSNWACWSAFRYLFRERPRVFAQFRNEKLIGDILVAKNGPPPDDGEYATQDDIDSLARNSNPVSFQISDITAKEYVTKLAYRHPEQYEFLRAMYGVDKNSSKWQIHIARSIAEAARAAGTDYNESVRFHRDVIVSYFKRIFEAA